MNSAEPTNDVDMVTESIVIVSEIEAEFLPLIHDIVKTVEKDPQDAANKNKESLEASQKVQDLSKKLDKAREDVKKLAGVDFTKEEQAAQLKALKKQLKLKQELILKYKRLGNTASFINFSTTNQDN